MDKQPDPLLFVSNQPEPEPKSPHPAAWLIDLLAFFGATFLLILLADAILSLI